MLCLGFPNKAYLHKTLLGMSIGKKVYSCLRLLSKTDLHKKLLVINEQRKKIIICSGSPRKAAYLTRPFSRSLGRKKVCSCSRFPNKAYLHKTMREITEREESILLLGIIEQCRSSQEVAWVIKQRKKISHCLRMIKQGQCFYLGFLSKAYLYKTLLGIIISTRPCLGSSNSKKVYSCL